jgi:hypothetical protein
MRIPEIREELHQLAEIHGIPRLHELAEETKRRPPAKKRAKPKYPPPTDGVVAAIKRYVAKCPEAHLQDIAVKFRTNTGRVSEILGGMRE